MTLISTGLADLDNAIGGGLRPGTLTLIAGPADAGKTTLINTIVAANYGTVLMLRIDTALAFSDIHSQATTSGARLVLVDSASATSDLTLLTCFGLSRLVRGGDLAIVATCYTTGTANHAPVRLTGSADVAIRIARHRNGEADMTVVKHRQERPNRTVTAAFHGRRFHALTTGPGTAL